MAKLTKNDKDNLANYDKYVIKHLLDVVYVRLKSSSLGIYDASAAEGESESFFHDSLLEYLKELEQVLEDKYIKLIQKEREAKKGV